MIYRIADPPAGGKGVLGIYPAWDEDGSLDAQILAASRERYISVLFTRNYASVFFERIASGLVQYGRWVDVICGWDTEKLLMFFRPINPGIEVFPLSAMNFNTFPLLDEARNTHLDKRYDIFFSIVDRSDGLKNTALLVHLLAGVNRPLSLVGYGRLDDAALQAIMANPHLVFTWRGKTSPVKPEERRAFLADLAASRCLLVTSRAEGYCRMMGEALYLHIPVMLEAGIQCENWVHLSHENCCLFNESSFSSSLDFVLQRVWSFQSPVYEDGNLSLKRYLGDYLLRRGLPEPQVWYPLEYGAVNDEPYFGN